ncbi:MAG TPA: accessory Sec system translocase SecA2, partial [Streptosporangiaceae bacterium]
MSKVTGWVRRILQEPGTASLARYQAMLPEIARREQQLGELTDAELTALADGAAADVEICSLGREASRRALGERPYDVQLLGTLAMLSGRIAEMATGEGKTLAGAIAAAGYALRGRSVHVMSVNDYLARRDAQWMRPVYDLLGVSVGWIDQTSTPQQRRDAYAAQVTYASVSEFGFDVLRDRLCTDVAELIAGEPDVVLIDEADSVLVDEALVPLVLAGAVAEGEPDYEIAALVRRLRPGVHYQADDDGRAVHLTDKGTTAAEQALGGIDLYAPGQLATLTRLNVALYAHALLRRDVDYIVTDGRVRLVSESRGRVARLQRWPDGLHEAVEAKEGLIASDSGMILDSITVQALIKRYPVRCGMTGTAVAAGEQFREFYQMEIAVVPPNLPCVRDDEPDRLYRGIAEKERAIVADVAMTHATGRPILIGTLDVAESERLAGELAVAGLPCVVLNARNDAQEAAIVAEAGALGAITVSTQMAGRGTDIRLGGSAGDRDEIARLGGLKVIGTGRHASSRLDHQLRGRAGRQGDPGSSVFYVSMADPLITTHVPDAEPPETAQDDGLVTDPQAHWTVGHAQRVAEGANLEIHRNTWRYNAIIEEQRRVVSEHRDRVLRTDAALTALGARCPERLAGLSETVDRQTLVRAARQIVLAHLDRGWSEHLARMSDIREGIHLRSLGISANPFGGRMQPLDEFNKEAVRAFTNLLRDAEEDSAETFRTARIDASGVDLDAAGLKRPTATWTYLVTD